MTDTYLGCDGVSSDEMLTRYYLRGGEVVVQQWGRADATDPERAIFDLEQVAAISESMAEHGGDYPARAAACRATIARIREVVR